MEIAPIKTVNKKNEFCLKWKLMIHTENRFEKMHFKLLIWEIQIKSDRMRKNEQLVYPRFFVWSQSIVNYMYYYYCYVNVFPCKNAENAMSKSIK